MQLQVLQQRVGEFEALDAKLVAISPEKPDHSLTMKEKHELTFHVLSDLDNQVARRWGLVFQVEGQLRQLFEGFGMDLADHNGTERWELPMPGTFVVDRDGVARFAFAQADYTVRAEPDDVLAVLREL